MVKHNPGSPAECDFSGRMDAARHGPDGKGSGRANHCAETGFAASF